MTGSETPDFRQHAPATQRNRQPILAVLQRVLPPTGVVLEIASGTGEHAVFFAPQLAPRDWLPSDANPQVLHSIQAWRAHESAPNLYPPILLDATADPWPVESGEPLSPIRNTVDSPKITAIVAINMIHISPWASCLGLMAGAKRILPIGGVVYLYGPFHRNGQHTSPSNMAFDQSLRSRNPNWGVRHLEEVVTVAQRHGLILQDIIDMPANNLSVVFERMG